MNLSDSYKIQLEAFKLDNVRLLEGIKNQEVEFLFERIYRGSSVGTEALKQWYQRQVEKSGMSYELIPLIDCKGWSVDEKSGSLVHESGEFFSIDGIRVSNSSNREVTGGWDQPIVTQKGYDGGILGLIRTRKNGVPFYLVEAKSEPGNPNIVQISTTVQATFSNLKRAHGGNSTPYSEYFLKPENNDAQVIFSRWMSEDGGRLLNKRNKSMIVEVDKDIELINDRYRWVTLNDLVLLIKETDAIVAPHIRGIVSAIS